MKRITLIQNFTLTISLALFLGLLVNIGYAQTPGNIFAPNPRTPVTGLDPDGDGDVVENGTSFSSSSSEYNQFEGEWTKGYQNTSEPSGDLSGKSCGTSDVVDAGSNQSAYFIGIYDPDGYPANESGNEDFLFRLRVGKDPKNAQFGYSILIDSDQKYGTNDPNQVTGNDGFEYEIRLANGGGTSGVYLDDVDGTTNGSQISSYGYSTNHIRSYADKTSSGCKNDAVFIDVAVPYSDLPFKPSTSIRIAAATSSNGTSVLNGNGTDVAGLNDGNFSTQAQALSNLISSQSGTALPVELINFEVNTLKAHTNLTWSTASETNNSHFMVQRRVSGEWQNIGKVKGNGTATEKHTYTFKDPGFQNGKTYYYRLKQVDFDGSYEYSNVKSVKVAENQLTSIELYPNPVFKDLNLTVNTKTTQTMQVSIQNLHGQVVYQENISFQQGKNLKTLPLQQLEKGQYVIEIKGPENVAQKRLIKQ